MTDLPAKFFGVVVPALTPFTANLDPDATRLAQLCRWLLGEGAAGLAVFGTTGEGNSLSVAERNRLLDHLVGNGIPAASLLPGTGSCSIPDAVELTRHAVGLGAGGVLVLPPFYYKNQTDDGFFAYFSEIIQRVGDRRFRLYLYHFPQMSAAPISLPLIARLVREHPDIIAGLKDSSGDWEGTKRMIAEFPSLAIFPSSESRLYEGLALGAAGCISATANIQPRAIRRLIDAQGTDEAIGWHRRISAVRSIVEAYPIIAALKTIIARKMSDEAWLQTRPPVVSLLKARRAELLSALDVAEPLSV